MCPEYLYLLSELITRRHNKIRKISQMTELMAYVLVCWSTEQEDQNLFLGGHLFLFSSYISSNFRTEVEKLKKEQNCHKC